MVSPLGPPAPGPLGPTGSPTPRRSRSPGRPPVQYLPHDTITRLLSAAGRASVRDLAMFTTAYWHGLRASEVGLLDLTDWRPQTATTGRLYVRRLKGSVSAEYPVAPETARALRAWLSVRGTAPGPLFLTRKGGPPTRQTLDRLIRRYSEVIRPPVPPGLRHFHVLRHSVAVRMVERRLPLQEIRDWLGHKSTRSTEWYLSQVSPVRDRTAADLFRTGDGGDGDQNADGAGIRTGTRAKAGTKGKGAGFDARPPGPNWQMDRKG